MKQAAFALTGSLSKIPLQCSKGVIIQVQGLYISAKKRREGVYKQISATGRKTQRNDHQERNQYVPLATRNQLLTL